MASKEIELNLPTKDSLFTTQEQRDDAKLERVMDIPLSEIDDFPDHPFKVRMDEKMTETIESVKQYGVLMPALIRKKADGRYEMIAGHRRKMACELSDREIIPCIIRNLTDEEATILMVDSNIQRENILPSEKAQAYKLKMDAIRRQQGERSDLTCVPLGHKLENKRSREVLAENSPDSNTQIQRYLRLNDLVPELLEMVDAEQIKMRPAVELSYLQPEPRTFAALLARYHGRF